MDRFDAREISADFLRFFSPKLKTLRAKAWSLADVPPVLAALDDSEGNKRAVIDCGNGPGGFVRSIARRLGSGAYRT